jgi:dihydrolipoamide dehydrogenase
MVVGSLTVETDVVIIGSGPGGYVAAIRAAQLGKDVIVIEKQKRVGGVCLHVGCIPTKALITSSDYFNTLSDLDSMGIKVDNYSIDINKMNSWKQGIIDKLETGIKSLFDKYGIEVIEGVANFIDTKTISISGQSDVNTIKFKDAIIATGSSPIEIDGFKFDKENIISSNQAMSLTEVPKKMVIVGGGYIGTELGTVYGKLGSEVHILEGSGHLIPQLDSEVVDVVAKSLEKFNVNVHYNSKAKNASVVENGCVVDFESEGIANKIECDKVLVVVGRRPNSANLGLDKIGVELADKGFIKVDTQMKTSVSNIYAIGDVVSNPMLAHKASREGKIAAEVIGGIKSAFDNKVIPSVVFNDPEIISVGMTDKEAQDKGYEIVSKKFPYAALGRAHMFDRTNGFIKMICEKKTNRILGVHAVGPHVSEIVAEATLAIEMGANAEDIAFTIHPHPTISEGLSEVSDVVLNKAINIYQKPGEVEKKE